MNDSEIGAMAERARDDLLATIPLLDLLREKKDHREGLLEHHLASFCAGTLRGNALTAGWVENRRGAWASVIDMLFLLDMRPAADVVRETQARLTLPAVPAKSPSGGRRGVAHVRPPARYAVVMTYQSGETERSQERFASLSAAQNWIAAARAEPLGRSCMYRIIDVTGEEANA